MKIVEHTLKEELDNYIKKYNIDMSKVKAYKLWPIICGPQLSAVTSLVGIKDNKLRVKTESASAKSLLILQKNKIMEKYNEMIPNSNIVDIEIVKRY